MGIRDLRLEYSISNENFFRSDQLPINFDFTRPFCKFRKNSNTSSFESESPLFFRPQQPEFITCFAILHRLLIINKFFRIRLKTITF
jgi:hypothetical protein